MLFLGLAHFEALTDLSQVSQEKLDKQVARLSGDNLAAIKTDLALIRDASDLGGMDWEASCKQIFLNISIVTSNDLLLTVDSSETAVKNAAFILFYVHS